MGKVTERETDVSIRQIVWSVDLEPFAMTWAECVEAATVYAIQLGYRMNPGTGGAYVDATVSEDHAAIIADLINNTDPVTGVYTGDREAVTVLAAGDVSA